MDIYVIYSSDEDGCRVVEVVTDEMSLADDIVQKCTDKDPNKDYFFDTLPMIEDKEDAEKFIEDMFGDDDSDDEEEDNE